MRILRTLASSRDLSRVNGSSQDIQYDVCEDVVKQLPVSKSLQAKTKPAVGARPARKPPMPRKLSTIPSKPKTQPDLSRAKTIESRSNYSEVCKLRRQKESKRSASEESNQ